MGLSAVRGSLGPISKVEHNPAVHIRVKCKFLFPPPELQLLHSNCELGECFQLWGWIGAAIEARSVHSGWPVIHFTATAFKHDMHIFWYTNKYTTIFIQTVEMIEVVEIPPCTSAQPQFPCNEQVSRYSCQNHNAGFALLIPLSPSLWHCYCLVYI